MKTKIILLFSFLTFYVTNAQVADITGNWTMVEMNYVTGKGEQKMTGEEMKAKGSVTDYFFMAEGKFKMNSNMSGSGTLDTYEGTWKLEGKKLTYNVTVQGRAVDVVWDYEYKDDVMKLSRTSPDGSMTVINSFRKKQM